MNDQTTGNTDPTTGGQVLNFPRIGFNLNPTPTPAGDSAGPATRPDWDAVTVRPDTGRRSPLDLLNALPDPAILHPALPTTPTPITPGQVPAAFRSDTPDNDMIGPRLGALSLAAILAVAVAALRGTHTVMSTWWENRQARQAEAAPLREARLKHQAAMQGIHDKAAQQRAKRVPSSSEFGRKALGGSGRSGGSGGSGSKGSSGSGSKGSSRGPSTSGSGEGRGSSGSGSKNNTNAGSGSGRGGALKRKSPGGSHNSLRRSPGSTKTPKQAKGPHRSSQGAGGALKKHRTNNGATGPGSSGNGKGRTTLPQALKKDTQNAAARRLKKRRKNGLDKPALWGPDTNKKPGQKNSGRKNTKGATAPLGNGTSTKNAKGGRTTLTGAMKKQATKAARKRLKQRRRNATPPIWFTQRPNTKAADGSQGPAGKPASPKTHTKKASRKKDRAKKNARHNSWWTKWAKARTQHRKKADTAGPGSSQGPTGSGASWGSGARRSPFENAGQAAGATTYTVTSEHVPNNNPTRQDPAALTQATPALPATGPAALPAAPTPHTARPGTSRPKEPIPMPPADPDKRLTRARHQAARTGQQVIEQARHMNAQHATEITLDDAIDDYSDFKDDAFKTHDQCFKLAGRARKLRDILADFAVDLAVNHNLIGALFSGAMAESMDLLARMADEMLVSSLEAAEMAEAASNDLNDAYRPYSVATADAGLATPSAPIHNET
ncbi:hypothetical protein [Streptomyces pseudovenezuelae]|uniref:hypothetical protein n=1 Tax=Streptomyces pseudovenezuelae TaxID=67350 RepID=UPI002E80677F|nr:hypothetical protein [Streptomyces pseudovenezuelae]WUA94463.1 hypothetical protein OHO81_44615 [Streptomyces pseudovenezuelae]